MSRRDLFCSLAKRELSASETNRSAALGLFAKTPDAFKAKQFLQPTSYQALGLASHIEMAKPNSTSTYSIFSHSMRIQLLMRSPSTGGEVDVYSACLGCQEPGNGLLLALQLVQVQPGHYQRLASGPEWISRSFFERGNWSLRDVYVSSPRTDLASSMSGFIIPTEFCTIVIQSGRLSERYGVDLGRCSWPIRTDEASGERRFDIKSSTSSLGRAAMATNPLFLEDNPTGVGEIGSIVLRATAADEAFAIVLTIVACRLKATVVPGLPLRAFQDGYQAGKSKRLLYRWSDISVEILKKQLPGKCWLFVHAIPDRLERGMTYRMLLQIGIQT